VLFLYKRLDVLSWRSQRTTTAVLLLLLGFLLSRLQDLEGAHQGLIDAHHSPSIVELSTIVWSREEGHELPLCKEFISILDNLMCPADEVQVVPLEEVGDDVTSKSEAHAPVVLSPPLNVLIWIRPEQVAQEPSVWNVRRSHDSPYLLHCFQVRREPSVHAKDLLVDDGSDGQAVEALSEGLPKLYVVSPLAFVVETVDPINGSTLVIASQEEEIFWEFDLVGEQEADGLQALLSTVHIVSKKEIICLWWKSTVFKEP